MYAELAVVAATGLEAKEARRALPGMRVFERGIGLSKGRGGFGGAAVTCGLAGALRAGIPSGTVLVPSEVVRPDGFRRRCDPELVAAFAEAARSLGFEPVADPLYTAPAIVRGKERADLARGGCAGVDMETGLLEAPRIAAVRVVLDTPERELTADWLNPVRALLDPRNWAEAAWLGRDAPRYARRSAEVIAAACLQAGVT
jgi:hypothetical protein